MAMNDSSPPNVKRRWHQYSLRTPLLFVLVVGTGLGWLGSKVQPIRNELNAVASIQRLGGSVTDWHSTHGSFECYSRLERSSGSDQWLRRRLGAGFRPNYVELQNSGVTDADLAALRALPDLEVLWLHNTRITDGGTIRKCKRCTPTENR